MANRKLKWWARLTGRTLCAFCGELYATTTATDDDTVWPACEYCAVWIAADCPDEDPHDEARVAAEERLPWLLRHRPSVRLLNCTADLYREAARDPQARADAYDRLAAEYSAASWPVRFAYNAGQTIGRWADEARFHGGVAVDWARIRVTRPDCARCGAKATVTQTLRDGDRARTPLCDDCCYAINDGAELPAGGAR